jgi:hypothetical protein
MKKFSGFSQLTSEAKGLVPLTQPNILVAGDQRTVALPVDTGVICCRELYIGQAFVKHSTLSRAAFLNLFTLEKPLK